MVELAGLAVSEKVGVRLLTIYPTLRAVVPRLAGDTNSTMGLPSALLPHEWADPNYTEDSVIEEGPTYHRDADLIEQFKQDVASGSLANVLGVDRNLTEQQEASLARLEDLDEWHARSV